MIEINIKYYPPAVVFSIAKWVTAFGGDRTLGPVGATDDCQRSQDRHLRRTDEFTVFTVG